MATLEQLRDSFPLTRAELAERCGVTEIAIYLWERGERYPRPANIRKLAEVLGKTTQEVMDALAETSKQYNKERAA